MRFTILTLLIVTAYVAVTLAGIAQPDSYWPEAGFYFTVLLLIYLVAVACGPTDRFSIFSRGDVIGFGIFSVLRQLEPGFLDSDRLQLLNWYWSYRETNRVPDGLDVLAEQLNNLAFGGIFGLAALWRYRRQKANPNCN